MVRARARARGDAPILEKQASPAPRDRLFLSLLACLRYVQGDDDTTFYMDVLDGYLGALRGGALPLFLAPKLGPTEFWQNCRPQAQRRGIFANTCCTDTLSLIHISEPTRPY